MDFNNWTYQISYQKQLYQNYGLSQINPYGYQTNPEGLKYPIIIFQTSNFFITNSLTQDFKDNSSISKSQHQPCEQQKLRKNDENQGQEHNVIHILRSKNELTRKDGDERKDSSKGEEIQIERDEQGLKNYKKRWQNHHQKQAQEEMRSNQQFNEQKEGENCSQPELISDQVLAQITKELITFILQNPYANRDSLSPIIGQIGNILLTFVKSSHQQVNQLLNNLIQLLYKKFSKAKKTRQQIIKFIFRKIYNSKNKPRQINQDKWKEAQQLHKKNSRNFKSMSSKFVQKEFENPTFVELFQIFVDKFQVTLDKENQKRINRLNDLVMDSLIKQDFSELKNYKKLPYNKKLKKYGQSVLQDLKQISQKKNLQNKMRGKQILVQITKCQKQQFNNCQKH